MNAGDYVTPAVRLVRELRSGGMGTVWIAEQIALGTRVAVKMMKPDHQTHPDLVERFAREAQVTARIRSPHVVQMHDFGKTADGTPFIVMELLDGETLGDRIQRLRALPAHGLPLPDVVRIVLQVANALGTAHAQGVVHRDIKPDNIFLIDVGGEPFVKVLDFGLVKPPPGLLPPLTEPGQLMGSLGYISPEQSVSAKYVDHRADVWALGVVAYEALTGRTPFQGETPVARVLAMHAGAFTAPSALRPELPTEVDAWAAQAFHKEIEQRFGSVLELARALEAAMAAVASSSQPHPPEVAAALSASTSRDATPPPGEPLPLRPRLHVPVVSAPEIPAEPALGPFIEPLADPLEGTLMSGPSLAQDLAVGAGQIRIVVGNILEGGAEAIVHPSDPSLSVNGEIDARLHAAAGPELEIELRAVGGCPEGGAVITSAGRIAPPTRFIIHAVPPVYAPERSDGAELFRSAHHESLRLAEANGVGEVAFPAIGARSDRYPVGAAAPIAVRAAVEHLAVHARSVTSILFVLDNAVDFARYARALAEVGSIVTGRPRIGSWSEPSSGWDGGAGSIVR